MQEIMQSSNERNYITHHYRNFNYCTITLRSTYHVCLLECCHIAMRQLSVTSSCGQKPEGKLFRGQKSQQNHLNPSNACSKFPVKFTFLR